MVCRILEQSEQDWTAPEHFPIASLSTLFQGPEVPPRPPDNNLVFGGSYVTAGIMEAKSMADGGEEFYGYLQILARQHLDVTP